VSEITIEINKSIEFTNLLSIRNRLSPSQISGCLMNMQQTIEERKIAAKGPSITATYGAEVINGEHVIDLEMLIPVQRLELAPASYQIRDFLQITDALYTRHIGDPTKLQLTMATILKYIQTNSYKIVFPIYNVNSKDEVDGERREVIDIYINVSKA
jgi:effector-binding domain-containing protein